MIQSQYTHFAGIASYLPERVIENDYFSDLDKDGDFESEKFFRGVQERRWASPDETSVYMGIKAGERVLSQTATEAASVDLVIVSALMDDHLLPHVACGIQHGLAASNATAITLDTGCASFVSGLIYASAMIRSGFFNRILLLSIANFAGRVQGQLNNRSAMIPGDGASAILIKARPEGPDGLLGWWEKSFGQHYGQFGVHSFDPEGNQVEFWNPHDQIKFGFDSDLVDEIKANSRKLVPIAMQQALDKAGRRIEDIDLVLTHQPNRYLIDHWRQAVGAQPSQSHDTLARYGNLFQASIPISLEDAISRGKLAAGDSIAMASFAFAGELASAAIIRWN